MDKKVTIEYESDDCKVIKRLRGYGTLVVPASVEDVAGHELYGTTLIRNQLTDIIFSEGCTVIGDGWDIGTYEVIDHDDCLLREITLPSTIKKVGSEAFSEYCSLETVWIPAGTKSYFETILPKHLIKMLKEKNNCKIGATDKPCGEACRR